MADIPQGRLDLFVYDLCGLAVRRFLEPEVGRPLWDAGLNQIVAQQIARAGIPQQSITSVRIGNLDVPVLYLRLVAEACGLFGREMPNAGR